MRGARTGILKREELTPSRHPSTVGEERTGLDVLEGWLFKHNRIVSKKRCYFRTHNHHLLYWHRKPVDDEQSPAGSWDLWTVDTVDIDDHDRSGCTMRLTFAEGKRAHRLTCSTADMAQRWARELRLRRDNVIRHSHDDLRYTGDDGDGGDGDGSGGGESCSGGESAIAPHEAWGDGEGDSVEGLGPDAAHAVQAIDCKLSVADGQPIPYLTDADCRDRPALRFMNPAERRVLVASRKQIVEMDAMLRASES